MPTKTIWESEGKTPAGDPFLTVKQARGYYYYAERGGMDSVFFILYDRTTCKFAIINESKPPLDERLKEEASMATAFGGSIDSDLPFEEIVRTEVLEEAGYTAELTRIKYVGQTMVSTQMSQIAHGYLVDITGVTKTNDTEYELAGKGSRTTWLSMEELISNSDWKSMFILLKSQEQGLL